MVRRFDGIASLRQAIGERLGDSEWRTITQSDVDGFGAVTGSDDWIHVDPVRARGGPFGAAVAQGDLLVALMPRLILQLYRVDGMGVGLAYGSDRIRLPRVVPVGSRVRVGASLKDVSSRAQGVLITIEAVLEVEGGSRPAVIADILHYYARA